MKFFVDTADVAEIADLAATGLLDGVTTNPSLIAGLVVQVGSKMIDSSLKTKLANLKTVLTEA